MAVKTESSVEVGKRLRALRQVRGIPKERVALDLAMSSENWRHYETGRNHLPASMLPGIAETYGMSLVELVSALFDVRTESDTVVQNGRKTDNKITANYIYTDGRRIEARVTRSVEYASALGTRLQHVSLGLPIAAGVA